MAKRTLVLMTGSALVSKESTQANVAVLSRRTRTNALSSSAVARNLAACACHSPVPRS